MSGKLYEKRWKMVENKAALITGAAKRVGRAMALHLAAHGYDIALHYNNSHAAAQQLASEMEKLGRKVVLIRGDLNENIYEDVISQASSQLQHLSLLINNASIFERAEFTRSNEDDYDRHMTINLKAPYFLSQYFATHTSSNAHIINMLDTHVTRNSIGYFAYMLSKRSLRDLTRMTARALGPRIRVNAICPGLLLPGSEYVEEEMLQHAKTTPLRHVPSLDDINACVQTLEDSKHLTGQFLFPDGGQHLI